MMKRKLVIDGLLIIFVLCFQQAFAEKFNLSGSGALSITQTNINNKTIKDIPPDLTIGLEYLVNGRLANLDIDSSIALKFNNRDDDWNEIVESFHFGLSNPATTLNLGDFYQEISEFTLSSDVSPKFGLKINRNINLGEKSELMFIGGRLQEASVYESDINVDGILDADEDINKNGKWDYGYNYYDQWLSGVRFSSSPNKNTFLGMTYLKINDDKDSREETGTMTTPPIKNDVFALDSALSFLNHFLTLSGELSRARYEQVGSLINHDKAYKFSLKADKEKWNFEAGYNYIGTKYYSAGSPYLNTDKEGYFVTTQWLPNKIFSLTLAGEIFADNLLDAPEYPITDTNVITTTLKFKPQKAPQITLECELTDEKSDKYTTLYPQLDKFTKDISLELTHSIKKMDLTLNLQQTNTNDESLSPGTVTEYKYKDYKSDIISLTSETKFTDKFNLSNYLSYTKNKTGNEKDDTFNITIDLSYDILPQKLILKPGYEFKEYRLEKNCSSKEFTARMDVDYYLSTTSQWTFTYERKENKDLEDPATNYKADVGTIKYTRLF
ncbi:MAG: hypothetical protein QME42_04340 [bacterium]|nr:hypothetical protein [bacterium]